MEHLKKFVGIWILWFMLIAASDHECFGQTKISDQLKNRPGFRAGEIIIKIRDELSSLSRGMTMNIMKTGSRNLDLLNQQFGVTKVEQVFRSRTGRLLQQDSPLANVLLLNLREDVDERTALRAYTSLEEVEYAELNYLYYIFATPNDSFFSSQYALYSSSYQGIDAIKGWDIEQGDNSVIIAIIDTGIDYTHEDLSDGRVIRGYDFVNEDSDPWDDHGHGTHVAGITGAIANNSKGIAGVCPGCSLMAVKVITADGSGANSWIANGIANAVNLGARVINLSLGGLDRANTIELAVKQAYQSGVVIVAASGNDGTGVTLYPAAFSEVISVGATDRYGDRASFSNYGTHLEVAAPGQTIYSTLPGNSYEAWSGTSMACPHAAGLAGLILSKNPGLTGQQVRQIMAATAQDLGSAGRDSYFGYGRINAFSALSQTPGAGSNYPIPSPDEGPYPTPAPGYPGLCSPDMEGILAIVLVGLCWVNIERRKRKK